MRMMVQINFEEWLRDNNFARRPVADPSWRVISSHLFHEVAVRELIQLLNQQQLAVSSSSPKAAEWVAVTDRLPEKDAFYLVVKESYYKVGPRASVDVCLFHSGLKKWGTDFHKITYWMPLPPLPEPE